MTDQRIFRRLVVNHLAAGATNNFLWFALTFWVFLETRSLIAAALIAGAYSILNMAGGVVFGGLADRMGKRDAMAASSLVSALCYALAGALMIGAGPEAFRRADSPWLWGFSILVMMGVTAGGLRAVALFSSVALLVPEEGRGRANGEISMANGVGFALTSLFSGLAIGHGGMGWALAAGVAGTLAALGHLMLIPWNGSAPPEAAHDERPEGLRLGEGLAAMKEVPGFYALLLFTSLNNLLGGVFMALMDAYGLLMMSVSAWGVFWAVVSFGFIGGGLLTARLGVGRRPMRALLWGNAASWCGSLLFFGPPSGAQLFLTCAMWTTLYGLIEAAEATIVQKVIPPARQGRVAGLMQSLEAAVSPFSTLLIGPFTQLITTPFLTTGAGARWIGPWFGTGQARAIALTFAVAGAAGLAATLLLMASGAARRLDQASAAPAPA